VKREAHGQPNLKKGRTLRTFFSSFRALPASFFALTFAGAMICTSVSYRMMQIQ
jgi:hypothetical protein